MSINPLNPHYSMENPASVYDEEAMTALELAGRTAFKVNEVVRVVNETVVETGNRLNTQDAIIREQVETVIPNAIDNGIQERIDNGEFVNEINRYTGDIRGQLPSKVDKAGIGQITMDNLADEVKQAMTGGSVAVVGANSVSTETVQTKAITPEKTTFVKGFNEYGHALGKEVGYYLPGSKTIDGIGVANTYAMSPLNLEKGKTYYFRNIRGYLSHIEWADGTKHTFTTDDIEGSWEVGAGQAGTAYITVTQVNYPAFAVTDYKTFATKPAGVPGANIMPNLFPSFSLLKKLGAKGYLNGEGMNGGVVDKNTLTIPLGKTGNTSYIAYCWEAPDLVGKDVILGINFTIENGSTAHIPSWFTFGVNSVNSTEALLAQPDLFYQEADGTYTYMCSAKAIKPKIQIFLQHTRSMAYSGGDVKFIMNGGYILADNSRTLGGDKEGNIYTLRKDGYGHFSTVKEAFEYLDTVPGDKVLEIYPGTYNLLDGYTSEEINADNFQGPFVPDNCTIRGLGNRENIILEMVLDEYRTLVSALNLSNTAHMENITVKATKCRYVIHDDFARTNNTRYYRNVRNCVFIGTDLKFPPVYGSGTRQGAVWHFDNCEFINNSGGACFTNHNNINFKWGCEIVFDNCLFRSKGNTSSYPVVRLGSLNNGTKILTYVTFKGCHFDGSGTTLWLMEEDHTQYGSGILFKVSGYANKGVSAHAQSTDGVDYSGNIRLI